jgi:hypothetical protein
MTKQQAQKFLESKPASSGSSSSGASGSGLHVLGPKKRERALKKEVSMESVKSDSDSDVLRELEASRLAAPTPVEGGFAAGSNYEQELEEVLEISKYETSETPYLDQREHEDFCAGIEASLEDAFGGEGGEENPISVEESQDPIYVEESQDPAK